MTTDMYWHIVDENNWMYGHIVDENGCVLGPIVDKNGCVYGLTVNENRRMCVWMKSDGCVYVLHRS